jgi:hypothetical protein
MKRSIVLAVVVSCFLLGLGSVASAQTALPQPGDTKFGFSRDVLGTVTNTSVTPVGCIQVCFTTNVNEINCVRVTNSTPVIQCYSNTYPQLTCVTNGFETVIHCYTNSLGATVCYTNTHPQLTCTTNGTVTVTHCYTNIYSYVCTTNPVQRLVCSNDFSLATSVKLRQVVNGTITPNPDCDELGALVPSNAVFTAVLYTDLRKSDWRGLHTGSFKILDGTNTVAAGTLLGSNGVGSHGKLEACAPCNHLEGTLRGYILGTGPLHGALVQAAYAGDLPDVVCPSTDIPQGALAITLDGVVLSTTCPPPTAGP